MGWLSKIFGAGAEGSAPEIFEPEEYKGFSITPAPQDDSGQYRVAGVIRLGEQEHKFVRSDVLPSAEACASFTLLKAKKLIDEQGERIF